MAPFNHQRNQNQLLLTVINGEDEAKSANVFLSDDVFEKDKTFYPDFIRANNQCEQGPSSKNEEYLSSPNENNVLEGITDKNREVLPNEVLF